MLQLLVLSLWLGSVENIVANINPQAAILQSSPFLLTSVTTP